MADHICLTCNFCCDGTLFDFVALTDEEVNRLQGSSPVQEVEGRQAMRQACVHLAVDGCCTIYPSRPKKCAAFDCNVLKRLDAGHLTRAQADACVVQAKTLIADAKDQITSVCEGANGKSIRRMMHSLIDAKDGVPPDEFETAKRAYLRTAVYLEDHFFKAQD